MSPTPPQRPPSRAEDFLAGGGEMGERIRAMDWSKTAAGPASAWPQSLRIALRIMLTSRYAMWMGWGPELTFFCNDAYSPTLGLKHSWALGAPAREVWAERWSDIGPRAEAVLRTGVATGDEGLLLFLERSGVREETYHTSSYSLLPDDAGDVGGMLCVVTEDTMRRISERRLALLRELASGLATTHTEEEVFAALQQKIGADPRDLPFTLTYLFDADATHARLACATGVAARTKIAPARIDLGSDSAPWPARAILSRPCPLMIDDLAQRFEVVPTGPWDIPARQAILVPIAHPGQDRPAGVFIAAINPYRPFNAIYSTFVDLLAGQIASGLANAWAHEGARARAEALAPIDRAKTAFFSNASHELRTPLTLILGPTADALASPSRALAGAEDNGADDYLLKPFSARALIARASTHLEIAELRRAAERERERLFALFEQAPVAIAVLRGPDHVLELANPRCREIMGSHELIGRALEDVFPKIAGTPIMRILERVYATGRSFAANEFPAELDRGRGPEQAYLSFNLHPVRDGGAEGRILTVITDVTDHVAARKRLEEATKERERLLRGEQEARREAESANRAKDEFLAMLGHELRNPLAPITTALHLMRLRHPGVAERERTVIDRQVKHLTRLVDDLLDVSRVTRGKIELSRQELDLSEIVAKGIELASPLLEQRRHHLTITAPQRGLSVVGDATRLAQVISNLLVNAAKYTENEGKIEIEVAREGQMIALTVRDNGIGIDPEVLPKVFDLFVQERQALDRSQGGLGLGLAIVRSLVTMHGGSVSARSEGQGKGSEFTIRLPAAEGQGSEVGRAPAKRASPAMTCCGRRILVVDDNQDAAELLAESLSALGHATQVAHDGLSALQIAETMMPDVALLDIGLPVMDGYELARRLREQPLLDKLRLIAVTGYGQSEDRRRSREAGFDAHLVKPVQLDRLRSLLAEFGPESP